jgi:hypothetical protein
LLADHVTWPRPRNRHRWVRLLRGLWTLPTNLIGHAAGLLVSGGRRPRRVGGRAATGWLYPIRRGVGLDWVGAVTLGHAILYSPRIFEGLEGRVTLAHELAHTRQHDTLGPLYLPLHVLAQATSAAMSLSRGRVRYSRVHDHNPLEQTFICLSAGAIRGLATGGGPIGIDTERYLAEFGV